MEFIFENKPVKNIGVMKKDLANYIFRMDENELYNFVNHIESEKLKLPKSIHTCERCAELNGNNCDLDSCKERFKKYCEENVSIFE